MRFRSNSVCTPKGLASALAAFALALTLGSVVAPGNAFADDGASAQDQAVVTKASSSEEAETSSDETQAIATTDGSSQGDEQASEASGSADSADETSGSDASDAQGGSKESGSSSDDATGTSDTSDSSDTTDSEDASSTGEEATTQTKAKAAVLAATESSSTELDGIDISSNNGNPDSSGLNPQTIDGDFVIIKITEGTYYVNPYWKRQAELALAGGKLVGFYHFASSASSMSDQASYFVSNLNQYSGLLGSALLFLDWENTSYDTGILAMGPTKAKEFLDTVYSLTTVKPLVYMSRSVTTEYDWSSVANAGYGLWVAQYANYNPTGYQDDPWTPSGGYGAWSSPTIRQYSSAGVLNGTSNIDLDKFYGTSADWARLAAQEGVWSQGSDGSWYHYTNGTLDTGWCITAVAPKISGTDASGLQRYWLDKSTGVLAVDRLVTTDEGAGYYAYATPYGYVIRSAYKASDGSLYLANNDGRLSVSTWVVSSAYGQGLQRYWAGSEGAFAKGRLITPDEGAGYYAYATPYGYVIRSAYKASDGLFYLANNDGKLSVSTWVVSSAYGQGLQRYWAGSEGAFVKGRLVTPDEGAGYYAYATPNAYVVRSAYKASDGSLYLANNDGRLSVSTWVVSSAYGQGLQRYWAGSEGAFAKGRLVTTDEGAGWYAYATPSCYVVRGAYAASDGTVYIADNDGKLAGPGWVVGSYGQGLQRYWVGADKHGCVPGYSADGWSHYTTTNGYVARGACKASDGSLYYADNDGSLSVSTWLVTSAFGSGLQRYWMGTDGAAAKGRLVTTDEGAGWYAYATSNGYVVRGVYAASDGTVYVANNDGRLAGPGWVVGDYGQGLQRYWVDATKHGCVPGYSADGWVHLTLSEGYVMRNRSSKYDGVWYYANNDGLAVSFTQSKTGWQNPSQYYQVSAISVGDVSDMRGMYASYSTISPDATRDQVIAAFVGRAVEYLGTAYGWDCAGAPGTSVDCAGLVLQCMYAVGIAGSPYNPYDHLYTAGNDHYANDMASDSKIQHLAVGSQEYGDLIFYSGHVGIYVGNGTIINALPRGGVQYSSINVLAPIGVGRLFVK